MIKKAFNWLVYSSIDSARVSLTLRGVLVGFIPLAISVTHGLGLETLNAGDSQAFIDLIVNAVQAFLTVVAAVMAAFGAFRKIWVSLTGIWM